MDIKKRDSRAASYGIITIILISSLAWLLPNFLPNLGRHINLIITFVLLVNPFISLLGIIIGIKQLHENDKFGWITISLSLISVLRNIYYVGNMLNHFS